MKSRCTEGGRGGLLAIVAMGLILGGTATAHAQLYRDSTASIEARTSDLLARMTPEEKFWQLFMLASEFEGDPARFTEGAYGLQMPAELDSGGWIDRANTIQRHFVEETRLGIPIIFFAEALHGLVQRDATLFPQAIGLAASFDTTLMHDVAQTVALECRARGVRQVLSPVVNIATDVRWGRTEETYGEDPLLTSRMGVAFVGAFERLGIAATPKHFIANVGAGGRDSYPIEISERRLREIHLPPFAACIRQGGARSVMTAYNSYDGTPCSANDFLLNRVLKGDLRFAGVVISDANAVGGANVLHMTAANYADAGAKALNGGLDVIFQTEYEHHTLYQPAFLDGRIPDSTIDAAVARVLQLKFELGLFEHPYVDSSAFPPIHGPAARQLARRAAEESIVLLKNEGNLLPFGKSIHSLAVIGPEADTARFGGYSAPCDKAVTLLQGIRARAGDGVEVGYAMGCARQDPASEPESSQEEAEIRRAVDLAKRCDAAVLAVGIEEGEFRDRAFLALPGRQEELIKRVAAVGKPLVVVLTGGSAVTMSGWLDAVPAVLESWYPGEEGGAAVAAVLFGDANPGGRLPLSFPRAEGQLPLVYNHKPTGRGDDYADLSGAPQFPFGHGLSYTTFAYSDLVLDPPEIAPGKSAEAHFTLTNTGSRAGDEVVQLYLRDELASVSQPVLALKGFQRLNLAPGESRLVQFDITPGMLTLLDRDLHPVIEPGAFLLQIGASSQDIRLQGTLTVDAP